MQFLPPKELRNRGIHSGSGCSTKYSRASSYFLQSSQVNASPEGNGWFWRKKSSASSLFIIPYPYLRHKSRLLKTVLARLRFQAVNFFLKFAFFLLFPSEDRQKIRADTGLPLQKRIETTSPLIPDPQRLTPNAQRPNALTPTHGVSTLLAMASESMVWNASSHCARGKTRRIGARFNCPLPIRPMTRSQVPKVWE